MPQLNWNDRKRDSITALFEQFQRKPFRFSEAKGILKTPGDIQALAINGHVRKIYHSRNGIVWQLTEDTIDRIVKKTEPGRSGSL